ncbi:MAG: hypothetical protein ACYC7E_22580 [Armatimonadota bacterium]
MQTIWTPNGLYGQCRYANEAELEAAIVAVQEDLFGSNRIYLDIKKKIGVKGGKQNIPDGYLIDLNGKKPRLFVVENELNSHDHLKHIAVQILEFSLAFESAPHQVKKTILDSLLGQPSAKGLCERYAVANGFRNLDHLLDYFVHECPFAALVIIDEMPENLENVLMRKFQFGVEVLELTKYENARGQIAYHFEPFLADILPEVKALSDAEEAGHASVNASEYDTIVVPAHHEGFGDVFIEEDRWYAIRMHGAMRPQIKYIAVYLVAPDSAITHIAPVKSIEPWKDSDKYVVVNFAEPARPIEPKKLVKGGRVKQLYSPRYAVYERLMAAKNLDDVWI